MDSQELLGRVRALRATGSSPKEIARALGVSPATVAPLVRTIAAADQAGAAERKLVGCWVSPGWSEGLTVKARPEWPDVDAADAGAQGLVSVLVTREERYGRVRLCGWLVDVWCLGVKDVVGPRVTDERRAVEFTRSYFAAYQAPPLQAPVELARHLVFGAVGYARSLGFEPAPGFEATAGQLGPWGG
ncbi:MAG: helix-turn-helix domain-containing protein, partial [Actinomycetes bacterium]